MFNVGENIQYLVFDMDDTLSATGVYIRTALTIKFNRIGRQDLLTEMEEHLKHEGGLTHSKEIREFVYQEVISKDDYMLDAQPTALFYHFFIVKTFLPKNVKVVICTHRGFSKKGLSNTETWLNKLVKGVPIHAIHCLDSRTHPDKLVFLRELYGNQFLLIDDNPVHNLSVIHEPLDNVVIYDQYARYKAYQKQKRLIFDDGSYTITT